MKKSLTTIRLKSIDNVIRIIRNERVILDSDLAALYGVENRALIQAVKRNFKRFPSDFMFQLTKSEFQVLRSQIVISNTGRGGRRSLPYAFSEHGVVMAANLLTSKSAIEMSIEVVRAFVRLRKFVESNAALAKRIDELELRYDEHFKVVFKAIRQLIAPPKTRRKIGFRGKSQKTQGT